MKKTPPRRVVRWRRPLLELRPLRKQLSGPELPRSIQSRLEQHLQAGSHRGQSSGRGSRSPERQSGGSTPRRSNPIRPYADPAGRPRVYYEEIPKAAFDIADGEIGPKALTRTPGGRRGQERPLVPSSVRHLPPNRLDVPPARQAHGVPRCGPRTHRLDSGIGPYTKVRRIFLHRQVQVGDRPLNHPTDTLCGADLEPTTLQDFWIWAFSDLCDDDVKGIFAEWMVLRLLGISTSRRCSWADNDLVLESGVTIEVKSSAYWQSWRALDGLGRTREIVGTPHLDEAKIRFCGLVRGRSDLGEAHSPKLRSHLYVFAFQHHPDYQTWDAMDLSQWEFYVVPASALPAKSVSLKSLRAHYRKLDAASLKDEISQFHLK